jgi:hypothetical protein
VAKKRLVGQKGDVVIIEEAPDRCFLGVIAARGSIDAVGYFYGPYTLGEAMDSAIVEALQPGGQCLLKKFFDNKLQSGEWPVIGSISKDLSERFIVPPFLHYDPYHHRAYARHFHPDDFNVWTGDEPYFGDLEALPKDGTSGWMILLDHLRQAAGIDPKPVPEWIRMAEGRELNSGLRPKRDRSGCPQE